MSAVVGLSDDQWHGLLDNMSSRREHRSTHTPAANHPAMHHAGDPGFSDFNGMNFNSAISGAFDQPTNYGEPDFSSFAAQQSTTRQTSIDDTSIVDLQKIAKELEGVKQR